MRQSWSVPKFWSAQIRVSQRRSTRVAWLILLLFAAAGGAKCGIAQDTSPPSDSDPLALPQLPSPPPLIESPAAEKRIRRSLSGEKAPQASGDPLLDGVLEIIRSQGSLLEGSSLEESPEDHGPATDRQRLEPLLSDIRSSPQAGPTRPQAGPSRFRVAEMLLKTARLLAREPDSNESRTKLVARMRAEAADLLSQ